MGDQELLALSSYSFCWFEIVQWSFSPGTLVLITEHIGLMATQATELNKNKIQIT